MDTPLLNHAIPRPILFAISEVQTNPMKRDEMIEPLVRAGMDDTRLASFYIHSDGVLSVGLASTIKVNT